MGTSTKIIGNGLIAKSLTGLDFKHPTLILASGVSDSQETRPEVFKREADLVAQMILHNPDFHVLYFSTCSVNSQIQTPYISHKSAIEKWVLSNAVNCHIFRLPQVVGRVHNRTLVSYLVNTILNKRVFKLQTNSTRNLLDVRDVGRVASIAVQRNIGVGVPQTIASSTQIPVIDIVNETARLLNQPARIEMVETGYREVIDTTFLHGLLPTDDPLFDPLHWRRLLQHYVPLIAEDFANMGMKP
jgi:hypothetical protein